MAIDNNSLVQVLRTVIDPQSGSDLITMRMIEDLRIMENAVSFSVNTAGLQETDKFQLHEKLNESINKAFPGVQLNVHFVNKSDSKKPLSQVKNIIAVASGKRRRG